VATLLLAKGAAVDAKNKDEETSLHKGGFRIHNPSTSTLEAANPHLHPSSYPPVLVPKAPNPEPYPGTPQRQTLTYTNLLIFTTNLSPLPTCNL
jgi:hypothetical protein